MPYTWSEMLEKTTPRSQLRCGHNYGVVTTTVWSQLRCGHNYGVVTTTEKLLVLYSYSYKTGYINLKYGGVTNTADLLVGLL